VLQLLIAGAMIGMRLPPVLRSLHEAVGVSIWIATFLLAYLARIASGGSVVALVEAPVAPTVPRTLDVADAGVVRASVAPSRGAFASAVVEPAAREALETREPWQEEVIGTAPRQPEIAPPRAPQPEIEPPHPPIEEPHRPGRPAIDEPPTPPGPDIPPPSDVPPPPGGVPPMRMTMMHSVAVIVARGADF
jgi:hypothetical protein